MKTIKQIKAGTNVKMSQQLKDGLISNNCKAHVDEFGDCVGIVEDQIDPRYPDVNVRWQPSKLRYGYNPDSLDIVPDIKEVRKKKLNKLKWMLFAHIIIFVKTQKIMGVPIINYTSIIMIDVMNYAIDKPPVVCTNLSMERKKKLKQLDNL